MRQLSILVILFLLFSGCNHNPKIEFNKNKIFPEVKNLKEFSKTIFLPTLESEFSTKNNGIYAASFLLAWDEIKKIIADPIKNIDSEELSMIDKSDSYENVLSENEIIKKVEVHGLIIKAEAYFKKSLPFKIKLVRHRKPLFFRNDSVSTFGCYGANKTASIIYYNNDDDFAVKLSPANVEQEIILVKTNFADKINLKNSIENLSKYEANSWNYVFDDEDELKIPIIEFDIETNYTSIEGTSFSAGLRKFQFDTAYQRNAFILNEKGAEVESLTILHLRTLSLNQGKKSIPRKMIFNSPYLILLRKIDNKYPYFAMFVANSELMKKK